MKSKIIIVMLSGLLAFSVAVSAQDNPPAAASDSATSTNAVPPPDAAVTATNAAAAPDASIGSTNVPVQATAESSELAPSTTATNVATSPVIPLIVMDDVPLTDAIKNLARQANLNYMLDPRIAFGQPGPDGKAVPQPTVSIRWENITAEQALNAMLNNYGLQLVDDPKTKIARVTIRDPAAPDPLISKTVQLKYASPTNILFSVQTALVDKRSKIIGDIRTSQLVVLATEKEMDAVENLVQNLDTPTKQVLIEAKLLETSINPQTIKGVNWAGTLQGQNVAFGNNLQTKPVTTDSMNPPLATLWPKVMVDTAKGFNPATAFLNADGVNAVISFLNQNSEARVISEPRTVTLDNETAHLSVVRATPIINVTAGTANTTGGSAITYTNLGVILDVTPRISANNVINLKVIPQVSRKFDTVSKLINGLPFEADEYDLRTIETRVMIPSGNTLVLGGLVQDDIRQGNTKVPVLGDIPFMGNLFRSDSKSRQKSNLLVFITPTIVQDTDYQETRSDFLKTRLVQDRTPDWGAWDSGKPYDWSKITGR